MNDKELVENDYLYKQLSLSCRSTIANKGILAHRLHNSKSNELAFKYENRREFEIVEHNDYFEIGTRLVNYVNVLNKIHGLVLKQRKDPDGRRLSTFAVCEDVCQVSDILEKMVGEGFLEETIQNYL